MNYYFAFGSNMNPDRMLERDIRYVGFETGKIVNAKLKFNKSAINKNEGYANIIFKQKSEVEGILYELRSHREIYKLDRFEGYPWHYTRCKMMIRLNSGGVKIAYVYIATPYFTKNGLKPNREYLNHLLAAKEYLSTEYYTKLEDTQCI